MPYKVKEVANLVGVSIRTLHYYDEIGLLVPKSTNQAGHRLYTENELERLQQIMFFREIGFSIKEICPILDSPDFDRNRALELHRDVLLQQKKRLEDIIETVNKTIQSVTGGIRLSTKDMFEGFDMTPIEEHKKKFTAGGYEHTIALKADGTVWGWGNFGRTDQSVEKEPTLIKLLTNVKNVAAASGHYHSFAVKADGTVWGWGNNSHGQLGNGSDKNYEELPIQLEGLNQIVSVSAGVFHTLALKEDKTVWTWGPNWYGQLGDGTDKGRKSPEVVPGMTDVKEVSAGFFHSMALLEDGTVWRWGGFGDCTDMFPIRDESWVPVQVSQLDQVTAIAAGGSHAAALRTDGTVWTWGYNTEGQLGDGKFEHGCSCEPRMVAGLTDVTAIAAGGAFTIALKKDGSVWTWGTNSFGELGDGTNDRRSKATEIPGLSDVIQIAAGTKHSMAMTKDGSVWLWGSNDHGQLGDRTVSARNQPFKCMKVL